MRPKPGSLRQRALGRLVLDVELCNHLGGGRGTILRILSKRADCDQGTKFLSLDSISDALAKQLLDDLATYIQAHLTCSIPGGTSALLMELQNGKITQVIGNLPKCTWANGTGFEDGLNGKSSALMSSDARAAGFAAAKFRGVKQTVVPAPVWSDRKHPGGIQSASSTSTEATEGISQLFSGQIFVNRRSRVQVSEGGSRIFDSWHYQSSKSFGRLSRGYSASRATCRTRRDSSGLGV